MLQFLAYAVLDPVEIKSLETTTATPDDADIDCKVQIGLFKLIEGKSQKTVHFDQNPI